MPSRGILVAVILLAGLAGAIYWSDKSKKAEDAKPPADAAPKLVSIKDDQVNKFEVKRKTGDDTIVEKDQSGKWRMSSPKALPVDQDQATYLVSAFDALTWDRLIDEKPADLASFGLVPANTEITVSTKDGKTQKLLIGDDTPTGGSAFAKLEGDPRVFTIASGTKTGLDKSTQDLRDKRLMTFDSEKLSRVEVTAKRQTFELGKINQNEWQVLKPKPGRADGFQVEELLRKIKDAKMDAATSPEDAKKAVAAFFGGAPVATVRVTDSTGTQQIDIRKAKDNTFYAKSSVVEGVYKIANEAGEGLDKGLDDYRNKKLFDFGFNELSKVEVKDGDKTYTVEKSGDKWTMGGKQMDSIGVQALIDKLRDLAAVAFVENKFKTPQVEITVVWSGAKRTEKVLIDKQKAAYYAKRDGEPQQYQVAYDQVNELLRTAADVKPDVKPDLKSVPPNPASKK
jgi:hypothetical protein